MIKPILALAAALLSTSAMADTLIFNANGVQASPDGKVQRFRAILNGDDPRVLAMRTVVRARPWVFSRDPDSPAVREVLAQLAHPLFVELGPRNTLATLVRQHASKAQPAPATLTTAHTSRPARIAAGIDNWRRATSTRRDARTMPRPAAAGT